MDVNRHQETRRPNPILGYIRPKLRVIWKPKTGLQDKQGSVASSGTMTVIQEGGGGGGGGGQERGRGGGGGEIKERRGKGK